MGYLKVHAMEYIFSSIQKIFIQYLLFDQAIF